MELQKFKKKKIGILGLGIENFAMIKYFLEKKVQCQITICDMREKEVVGEKFEELEKLSASSRLLDDAENSRLQNRGVELNWKLGAGFNENLDVFNYLFRAPGWTTKCPGIKNAVEKNKKIIVTSSMNLFFELCPTRNIVGVTGTKGKGTTSSLICSIFKEDGKTVWLGGNIGIAPFEYIKEIKKDDWVILELSSFQLEDLEYSPHIAVITNFYREHLKSSDPNNPNYHSTLDEYWEAKSRVYKFQKKTDFLVLSQVLAKKIEKKKIKSKIKFFNKSDIKSSLLGEHNRENVAAAEIVSKLAKVKKKNLEKAVAEFKGLEHRLEFVKEVNGIKYYNDSFATTPESTITALMSFESPIVLLAGGSDKGSDFFAFAREIKKKVKHLILFKGEGSTKIEDALNKNQYGARKIEIVESMEDAIKKANKQAEIGDIVLLSTGCASFGVFNNYKERGYLFKDEVNKL